MSNKGQLLQDPFLNVLRREHVPVSIYLVNGIKLQGQVESFDHEITAISLFAVRSRITVLATSDPS